MLNIAIIGCGYWGPNLIRNFMACPTTSLTWVCDLDAARMERVMRPFPGVRQTTSLDDVLSAKDVDGIVIATPVDTHHPIGMAALKKGKHVLLEKPLASTVSQGEELVTLAREKQLCLMCDHTFCYTGAVRKIKEVVDSGVLGDILYYDSIRINLGLFQHDVNVIWDLAPHDLSIIDFLFNKLPIQVSAHGVSHAGTDIENIAYVTLTYPDSFIAHFHLNWLSPVKIRKTLIGGSKKMLEWNDLVPAEKIKIYDKGVDLKEVTGETKQQMMVDYRTGDIFSPRIDTHEALGLMVQEFSDAISEKRSPLTDGEAALRVLQILEATNRSIKADGANVRLSFE